MKHAILFIFLVSSLSAEVKLPPEWRDDPVAKYAVDRWSEKTRQVSIHSINSGQASSPTIEVDLVSNDLVQAEGFALEPASDNGAAEFTLSVSDRRGLLYGLDDFAEQWNAAKGDSALVLSRERSPRVSFRALKFNLPWLSYRRGEALQTHTETARDLEMWEDYLDMMVANRFNTLTLWSLHPFAFMVKAPGYPETNDFSPEEMADWQNFWKSLFALADQRDIDVYVFNWNIFTTSTFAKKHNIGSDGGFFGEATHSEVLEDYTRKIVAETLKTYPSLDGIGITLGERMGGMTPEERKDWLGRTIIAGIRESGRPVDFFYRAPLSANKGSGGSTDPVVERMTRAQVEGMDDFPGKIHFGLKFNQSHGHGSPFLEYVHGGPVTDAYWKPLPKNYDVVFTIRNEEFFILRWGQPDFIRELLVNNTAPWVGGFIIGSEVYIPAKDYITPSGFPKDWRWAFERQWLFYDLWGRLLYDPATPDSVFGQHLASRFDLPLSEGREILDAFSAASLAQLHTTRMIKATADGWLYSEGHLGKSARKTRNAAFLTIDTFVTRKPQDRRYISIHDYVTQNLEIAKNRVAPPAVAEDLERNARVALETVAGVIGRNPNNTLLEHELNDVRAWGHLGLFLADKIRGGIALERFRAGHGKPYKDEAIAHLSAARDHWADLSEVTQQNYPDPIPYLWDDAFSWAKFLPEAEADIEIARKAKVGFFPEVITP